MAERCKSCNAPIVWAVTEKHNSIPVDEAPREDGNLWIVDDGEGLRAHNEEPRNGDVHRYDGRYVSHFATCPQASKWRRNG